MNFTISELCKSNKANELKISNVPTNIQIMDNLLLLIVECLQPLRDKLKKPIIITSGFRNDIINKLVGGAKTSEHTKGMAADFIVNGMTSKQIIDFICKSGIKYTQLIEEYANNTSWVHISYNCKNLKCETLLYKNNKYSKR